jgi:acyl-CoA synthetase (AMP-forming)/AMP-acid ligase II
MDRGTSEAAPESATLVELLCRWSIQHPDRCAYTFLRGDAAIDLTYGELDRRARAIGAALQALAPPGERALLLYPAGPEFIAAFFGCLYAGIVAVPAYPPDPGRASWAMTRSLGVVRRARPRLALTEASFLAAVDRFLAGADLVHVPDRLATDQVESELAPTWRPPPLNEETLAFLQYTSGSTATPRGVMVSHGNVLANAHMIRQAFGLAEQSVGVGWLPLHHDMGLIGNVLETLYVGGRHVLMPPAAFLERPVRWLEAVSRYRATVSGGPNFAYDLCVRKVPPDERAGLDLSSWGVAFNGAEPVRRETLNEFAAAFGPCGFRREAFTPCYGLAEATLLVTASRGTPGPVVLPVQRRALERNRVMAAGGANGESRPVVCCGRPAADYHLAVVDPRTLTRCPPDRIGEIWVKGGHVAGGYWNRAAETEAVFRAHLADTSEGPFLRTGDLGFLHDGGLFVTGRSKDLIIVHGANHYPEDIEATVERSHPALRPQGGAAFAVEADDEVRVVVAHEVARGYERSDLEQVLGAVRRAVAEEHALAVHTVLLLRPGSLPRTSSGKTQRHACVAGFLEGILPVLASSVLSEQARPVPGSLPTAPGGGLERWLADLWCAVMGLKEVGTHDHFAELGGNSVQAAQLANRLQQRLGAIVPPVVLFEAPTIAELARYLVANYPQSFADNGTAGPAPGAEGPVPEPAPGGADGKAARLRRLIRRVVSPPAGDWVGRAKNRPAVFILSPPRSGSTLLRVLLAGHPKLFAPPELELLGFHTLRERRAFFSGRQQFWLEGALRAVMESKGCDGRAAERIVRDCEEKQLTVPRFYGLIQEWLGDRILVDKTPSYSLAEETLELAERDFDNPLYIHLLRHPCGMIRSFEEVKLHLVTDVFFAQSPALAPRELAELIWLISHENIVQFLAKVPEHRQHRLEFEHLVSDPRTALEGVCHFLDLELVPDMLQPYKEKKQRMTDGVGDLAPMVGDPKFHTHQAIDATVAERWKKHCAWPSLGARTWEVAGLLGYRREAPPAEGGGSSPQSSLPALPGRNAETLLAGLDRLSDEQVETLFDAIAHETEG